MTGPVYHRLLQYQEFPELRQWNGGTLDRLVWQQVKFFIVKVLVTEMLQSGWSTLSCDQCKYEVSWRSVWGEDNQQEDSQGKGLASQVPWSESLRFLSLGLLEVQGKILTQFPSFSSLTIRFALQALPLWTSWRTASGGRWGLWTQPWWRGLSRTWWPELTSVSMQMGVLWVLCIIYVENLVKC